MFDTCQGFCYEPYQMTCNGQVIYGLFPYGSLFNMRVRHGSNAPMVKHAQRVYNFKKRSACAFLFKELIERFASVVQADIVIAAPSSSTAKVSALQKLFPTGLKRTADSLPRKYSHGKSVNYDDCIEVNVDVVTKKVLLVDDIVTSGWSILALHDLLKRAGASEVILLGCGVNWLRLDKQPDSEEVERVTLGLLGSRKGVEMPIEDEDGGFLDAMLGNGDDGLMRALQADMPIMINGALAMKIRSLSMQTGLSHEALIEQALDAI